MSSFPQDSCSSWFARARYFTIKDTNAGAKSGQFAGLRYVCLQNATKLYHRSLCHRPSDRYCLARDAFKGMGGLLCRFPPSFSPLCMRMRAGLGGPGVDPSSCSRR